MRKRDFFSFSMSKKPRFSWVNHGHMLLRSALKGPTRIERVSKHITAILAVLFFSLAAHLRINIWDKLEFPSHVSHDLSKKKFLLISLSKANVT